MKQWLCNIGATLMILMTGVTIVFTQPTTSIVGTVTDTGKYRLRAELAGFATVSRKEVVAAIGQATTTNLVG